MLEELVQTYGYLAVFVGTLLEGETIVVLAAFAAQRGYLRLEGVIIASIFGSVLGDQLYFLLARKYGTAFLSRHPRLHRPIERALRLLDRYSTFFLLTFRFYYGLRAVSSFAVGLTKVPLRRFAVLNIIGAVVWAITLGVLGFVLGEAFERFFAELKRYEMAVFGVLAGVGILFFVIHRIRASRAAKKELARLSGAPDV